MAILQREYADDKKRVLAVLVPWSGYNGTPSFTTYFDYDRVISPS